MRADELADLLEKNRETLKVGLGGEWDAFAEAYHGVVADLPDEPTPDDLAGMADRVVHLLARHESGRELLRQTEEFRAVLPAPSDVLLPTEEVQQVGNRFRLLVG